VSAWSADDAMTESLRFIVPLHILELRSLPPSMRAGLAAESAKAVSSQGDTLQYGSGTRFGAGERELLRHRAHGPDGPDGAGSCTVCTRGQATFSAGEVFSHLARGLAIAAYQPGGISFAGLHWCADPHPDCLAGREEPLVPALVRPPEARRPRPVQEVATAAGVL
jgi:hypothetical protein